MSNKSLSIEQIYARGDVEGFTAYSIWRILDVALRAEELEGFKRPQMVYNYDRNGYIVKGEKNVSSTRGFTRTEVETFVEATLEKARVKQNKVETEVFDGESDVEIEQIDMDQMV
jgi:hypothetical protein